MFSNQYFHQDDQRVTSFPSKPITNTVAEMQNDAGNRPDSVLGHRRHSPSNRHRRSNRTFVSPSPPPPFGQSGRQKYNPLRNTESPIRNTDSPFRFNGDNGNGRQTPQSRNNNSSFREARPLSPVKLTSGKNFTTASEFFLKKSDSHGGVVSQGGVVGANNNSSHHHFSSAGTDSPAPGHHEGNEEISGHKPKCQCRHHQQNNHEKKEPNPAFVQAKRVFKYGNAFLLHLF